MERLVKCFCGWQGFNVISSNSKSACPVCNRRLDIIKCEGCGE